MLLLTVAVILGLTFYLIVTSKVKTQERDEMLQDEEMWP